MKVAVYDDMIEITSPGLLPPSIDYAAMERHMRTFDGGNAVVNQLLQEYRNTYKRRKNMMAALKNV